MSARQEQHVTIDQFRRTQTAQPFVPFSIHLADGGAEQRARVGGGPEMKWTIIACSVLLMLAGGCANRFAGEWLEEGSFDRDGTFVRAEGPRRSALKFMPPSTVRFGKYVEAAGVVDAQGCQQDTYFTMSDGTVAQFGSTIARVEGDHLMTFVGAEPVRQYVRVKKRTEIFPPMAVLPSLAKADGARRTEPTSSDGGPVFASTSARSSSDRGD
jgi:hypothetical protein